MGTSHCRAGSRIEIPSAVAVPRANAEQFDRSRPIVFGVPEREIVEKAVFVDELVGHLELGQIGLVPALVHHVLPVQQAHPRIATKGECRGVERRCGEAEALCENARNEQDQGCVQGGLGVAQGHRVTDRVTFPLTIGVC